MSEQTGLDLAYYEIGEPLSMELFQEALKQIPDVEADPDFAFLEYHHQKRYEEAFAEVAGYMWKHGKRLPDKILDKWDEFIFEPWDEEEFYDSGSRLARECLDLQRALPKE